MLVAGYYPWQAKVKNLKGDIQIWENEIRAAKRQLALIEQPHNCDCRQNDAEDIGVLCPFCNGVVG